MKKNVKKQWVESLFFFKQTHQGRLLKVRSPRSVGGDLSAYDRHSKEFIVKYLAQKFRGRQWQREVTSYGELASGVDNSLLIDLIGKHHAEAVRTMALHMISQGRVEPISDRLLDIMLDDTDYEIIRV